MFRTRHIRLFVFALVLAALPAAPGSVTPSAAGSAATAVGAYVATSGSDAAACTRTAPCRTFDRAYRAVQPGQAVEVAAGTYPLQVIEPDPSKSGPGRVVFRPAPGAQVVVSGNVRVRASRVEVREMTVHGLVAEAPAERVVFRDIDGTAGILFRGAAQVSLLGGDIGPGDDYSPLIDADAAGTPARDVLIDGVTFHDWRSTNGSSEVQCLRVEAVEGLVIRNSRFRNCELSAVFVRRMLAAPTPTDVTLENNFIGCCRSGHFSVFLGDARGEVWQDVLIRNNSTNRPMGIGPQAAIAGDVRFFANIAPSLPCRAGVTSDYNVLTAGSPCGPQDLAAPSGFVDPAGLDFHLLPTAAAIGHGHPGNYPEADIDGDARPIGALPDAGADEAAAPDTEPPTTPSGLAVTEESPTSLSVAWSESSDDVGVAGYELFRGGTSVGATTETTYTFAGLACGTSYTLGVEAFDEAGNHSARATVDASTAACPPDGATVFVSPSGSDANPCTEAAPCRSFDRAYRVASPGDLVEVAGGAYPNQALGFDSSKTSPTDVVFRPAAGAAAVVGSKPPGQRLRGGIGLRVAGAKHVTFRNLTIRGDVEASGGAEDVTFESLVSANGLPTIYAPTREITFLGGSYGNTLRYMAQVYPSWNGTHNYDVTFDGTVLHDVRSDDLYLYHVECMLVSDAIGLTLRNMRTFNCDVFDVSLGVFGDGVLSDVLVDNNFFASTGPTVNASLGLNTNTTRWTGLNVRNNSALALMRHPECGGGCTNVRYSGNISPLLGAWQCVGAVSYRHNLWIGSGARCGSTDRAAPAAGFVDPAAFDLHLGPGSPAIDAGDPGNFPPTDIDGEARPRGGGPDAGADEAR